jgi:mRNA interferase RelE/StbE
LSAAIDSLAIDPRPSGVKKLKDEENVYRILARDYRIVYEIQDDELIILVIKIGHRRVSWLRTKSLHLSFEVVCQKVKV